MIVWLGSVPVVACAVALPAGFLPLLVEVVAAGALEVVGLVWGAGPEFGGLLVRAGGWGGGGGMALCSSESNLAISGARASCIASVSAFVWVAVLPPTGMVMVSFGVLLDVGALPRMRTGGIVALLMLLLGCGEGEGSAV